MKRGRVSYVKGDVCDPQRNDSNEIAVIPHCCNTLGIMGAGVALALKKKWPIVYDVYKKLQKKSFGGLQLGDICSAKVNEHIIVVNMIGQDGVVSPDNPKPVKYWALLKCMEKIRANITNGLYKHKDNREYVVHTCKFGSGLAQGNFDLILELIKEQWIDYGIDVVIYEFE